MSILIKVVKCYVDKDWPSDSNLSCRTHNILCQQQECAMQHSLLKFTRPDTRRLMHSDQRFTPNFVWLIISTSELKGHGCHTGETATFIGLDGHMKSHINDTSLNLATSTVFVSKANNKRIFIAAFWDTDIWPKSSERQLRLLCMWPFSAELTTLHSASFAYHKEPESCTQVFAYFAIRFICEVSKQQILAGQSASNLMPRTTSML